MPCPEYISTMGMLLDPGMHFEHEIHLPLFNHGLLFLVSFINSYYIGSLELKLSNQIFYYVLFDKSLKLM